jgi:hypothetical protein
MEIFRADGEHALGDNYVSRIALEEFGLGNQQ